MKHKIARKPTKRTTLAQRVDANHKKAEALSTEAKAAVSAEDGPEEVGPDDDDDRHLTLCAGD